MIPLRVVVTDLVGHPGETRPYATTAARADLGPEPLGLAEGALSGPITLDLHLDAVVEGVLVRGSVAFTLDFACARCLTPRPLERRVEVAELFADPRRLDPSDDYDAGYTIVDDLTAIDLTTLLRDTILVDLPVRVLCRDDCRGLCPTCGVDLNHAVCGHGHERVPDPRWAQLANLDVPPG